MFRSVETARKNELSELIRSSGMNYSQIALQAGVERRAVKRAADGQGIRLDTAVRIEFYLEWYIRNSENRK